MANFIDNLSDYNHAQGVTYKHVTLMSELSRIVEHRLLMQVRQGRADHNVLFFGGGGGGGVTGVRTGVRQVGAAWLPACSSCR